MAEQPVTPNVHGPVAMPRLDEPAPPFEGRSTHGRTKLADFRGKWLVFFAHPADFTPVCASELVAFARRAGEFSALNCALLGLSVDSVYAHIAWRESIRQKFGVLIDYPIMEDVTMEISRRYGMVQATRGHASTARLLQALQTADRLQAMTPEGWKPGDDVIEPPPDTVDAAALGHDASYGCVDWYYWKKAAGA